MVAQIIAVGLNIEVGEDDAWQNWKGYFEDLFNVNTEHEATVSMRSFEGAEDGKYFRVEPAINLKWEQE